jgi:hypothetical protein
MCSNASSGSADAAIRPGPRRHRPAPRAPRRAGRLRRSRPDLGLLITESTPKLLDKIVDNALTIERREVN